MKPLPMTLREYAMACTGPRLTMAGYGDRKGLKRRAQPFPPRVNVTAFEAVLSRRWKDEFIPPPPSPRLDWVLRGMSDAFWRQSQFFNPGLIIPGTHASLVDAIQERQKFNDTQRSNTPFLSGDFRGLF